MNIVLALLTQFVVHVPTYVIWIVGIFLAVTRRAEHPTGYPLVTIALCLLLVVSVLGTIVTTLLPILAVQNGSSIAQVSVLLGISNIIQTLVNSAAWVLLMMALFRRRAPSEPSGLRHEGPSTF